MERLSAPLIMKSIGFHGMPLQKIWEGERGENDLINIGIVNPDYSAYQARQKTLTFQDRAKRLKLHQFISKKASSLFDVNLHQNSKPKDDKVILDPDSYAILPPYEIFLNIDKNRRQRYFFDHVQPGDIVYGAVMAKLAMVYTIKILYSVGKAPHFVADLNVKAVLPMVNMINTIDKKGNPKTLGTKNFVKCEVVVVSPDSDKMILTMQGLDLTQEYGVIEPEDFPEPYNTSVNLNGETYEDLLEKSIGFHNPHCIDALYQELGLETHDVYTNMSGLRGRFPENEYGTELRQVQASKWAFRSVADGIEHFKEGRHSEAFQCLNKALNIDPRNVEGLVARGALYANSGSFKKAVEDFETALKLNPSHANARKYMGETLVALGRSYEEEGKFFEAEKAYHDCLAIIPYHEEAQNSLDYMKRGANKQQIVESSDIMMAAFNINKPPPSYDHLLKQEAIASTSKVEIPTIKKEKRSKKKKGKSKKDRRSTSSSDSSSDSSDSSSGSSSSSDSSSSDSVSRKKSKKSRQKSMSPLSKRMALMGNLTNTNDYAAILAQKNVSQLLQHQQLPQIPIIDDYELKVRKFLEMTRDDDNVEDKVRRFIEEASKHQKDRKESEEKSRKKKKKESKKARREERRRKRKEKKNKKKNNVDLDVIENAKLREALKIFENFPVLDEIGTKLHAILEKNKPSSPPRPKQERPSSTAASTSYKTSERELKDYQNRGNDKSNIESSNAAHPKWKMSFAKDSRSKSNLLEHGTARAFQANKKKIAFLNESDSDDAGASFSVNVHRQGPPPPPPERPRRRYSRSRSRSRSRSSERRSKTSSSKITVRSGPVVLDKFGNFRLAQDMTSKPPEPPESPGKSRSRSRSRRRRYSPSVSRSRSRSPRRGRSRSRSYRHRYSRSLSRSKSRSRLTRSPRSRNSNSQSRSRSSSFERQYEQSNYKGPISSFDPSRWMTRGRGRARGFLSKLFRGGNRGRSSFRGGARGGRFVPSHRSLSPSPEPSRLSPQPEESYDTEDPKERPRERSISWDRLLGNDKSKETSTALARSYDRKKESEANFNEEKRNAKAENPMLKPDSSLEEMEQFIFQAKKENKEDMMERNKDLIRKGLS